MPPPRKVTTRQMDLLLDFVETHRDIALGRSSGILAQAHRQAWESFAITLNSNGLYKTPEQWRRFWIEFKAKSKAKASDSRRDTSGTGGGLNKLTPLDVWEKRVLQMIGPVTVKRSPSHMSVKEPSAAPKPSSMSPTPDQSTVSSAHPMSPEMDVEWLEEPDSPAYTPSTMNLFDPVEKTEDETSQPTDLDPLEQPDIKIFQPEDLIAAEQPPQRPVQRTSQRRFAEQPTQRFFHRVSQRRIAEQPTQRYAHRTPQRQILQEQRVPSWFYYLERRRLDGESRIVTALERLIDIESRRLAADVHIATELAQLRKDMSNRYAR